MFSPATGSSSRKAGAAGQGPGDFQPPLFGDGDMGGRPVGFFAQFKKIQELFRPGPDLFLLPALPGRMEHAEKEPGAGQRMHPDHDVFADREIGKELDLLIGAVDAQGGDLKGS